MWKFKKKSLYIFMARCSINLTVNNECDKTLCLFVWRDSPHRARASSFTRFLDHNDAPQSVGLLWTSDRLVAETSTWQHTTCTDKHPCPRWDSNPQSQQASGCRPTPQTAQPLEPANVTKLHGLTDFSLKKETDAAFQAEKSAVVRTSDRVHFQESV